MDGQDIKPGDRVICIDDTGWRRAYRFWKFHIKVPIKCPVKNKIYVVAQTGYAKYFPEWGLMLNLEGMGDRWQTASSFRKVDEEYAENVLADVMEKVEELELEIIE